MTYRWLTVVALCSVTLTGCSQTTSGLSSVSKKIKLPHKQLPIVRVLCLWEPSEGIGLNGAPARGFAGQVLFFNSVDPSPVPVEGKVEIYEFDDMGTLDEQAKPIHKFVFESGAWNAHQGDGSLGPGYNLFLPYVKKHSYETTCALRLRFTPENGNPVYSELNKITLPGGDNPNKLHATKSNFTGSVQELLHDRLGTLGMEPDEASAYQAAVEAASDGSGSKTEKVVGGTRIRTSDKSQGRLRTLTIEPRNSLPALRRAPRAADAID